MKLKLVLAIAGLVVLAGAAGASLLVRGGSPGPLSAYAPDLAHCSASPDSAAAGACADANLVGVSVARERLAVQGCGPAGAPDTCIFRTSNVASSALAVRDVDAPRSLLIVAGLERPYTATESKALDAYLRDGGTVLLLDDYGYAEDFTSAYHINSLKRPLLDKVFDRNQSFVKVVADVDGSSYDLMLDGPSGLQGAKANTTDQQVFISSSADSYLDLQPNGVVDVIDEIGPFAVGMRSQVGAGALYVIADSGFIDNDMLGRLDNQRFLVDFAKARTHATADHPGLVLFDESKKPVVASEAMVLSSERALLSTFRSLPVNGVLFVAALTLASLMVVLRMPGRESWVHRFLPRRFVAPTQATTDRDLLVAILETKRGLDLGQEESDPLLAAATADPQRVRESDIPVLLQRVRDALDLEFPDDSPLEVQ